MPRYHLPKLLCRLALPALLLGSTACQSTAMRRQQLASGNPLDQVTAAVWLAETGDADAVHRLVSLLEDRERTVRMYAQLALERLCGQTYGYEYYSPRAERTAAVRRWRAALRQGEVTVRTPSAQHRTAAPETGHDHDADTNTTESNAGSHE